MPRAVHRVSASMGALPDQGAGRRRREREPLCAGLAHRPRLRLPVRTPRIVWRVRGSPDPPLARPLPACHRLAAAAVPGVDGNGRGSRPRAFPCKKAVAAPIPGF